MIQTKKHNVGTIRVPSSGTVQYLWYPSCQTIKESIDPSSLHLSPLLLLQQTKGTSTNIQTQTVHTYSTYTIITMTQQQYAAPWPLYDLFLDVPHPAASKRCPPPLVIGAPPSQSGVESIEVELQKSVSQIARFAFPEYDQDAQQRQQQQLQQQQQLTNQMLMNRFDQYAMQPPAFQNYTFSLTLQSGQRVQGHVRRYLPCHAGAPSRYDVGRRGERALVVLTRSTGADIIYSAMLK